MRQTLLLAILICAATAMQAQTERQTTWVGTWATAVEYTGTGDMPPCGTLTDRAIRQVVKVSIGGAELRLRLSNEQSTEPVEIRSVSIADAADSCNIVSGTAKTLRFDGRKGVTIKAGEAVFSDITAYRLRPLQRLAITICYGQTPKHATSHRGSRTTSYIIKGVAGPKTDFSKAERTDHWYNIASIDVRRSDAAAIAILGNSITDGRGSTTNAQNRWTDAMAEALQQQSGTDNTGILNLGIGGNAVFYGGLSEPAVQRFDRDILGQSGLKAIIIFEGVNDIGPAKGDAEQRAEKLIECYRLFIGKARAQGLKVYMGTIMPFRRSMYDDKGFFREAARQTVNRWIRESGEADGVIDFDRLMADPTLPDTLREEYQSDWLHPNPAGYKAMGRYAAELLTAFDK